MTTEPRVVCISQARMTSTRLPGKVLMEAGGAPLLTHHLTRLKRAARVDAVVLATTVNATDDPVATLAEGLGVPVFRGDEADVLARFAGAAAMAEADIVIRVTADCPLIDPALIDRLVDRFLAGRTEQPPIDYLAIDTARVPRGFDAEIFRRVSLDEAARLAREPAEREHVTPYLYRHPETFRVGAPVGWGEGAWRCRMCVDEPGDLELIRRLLAALLPEKPDFGWRDCCAAWDAHPEWHALNDTVVQKTL
jgi:spore coat polysaccharide biosynthesis protein SpsF